MIASICGEAIDGRLVGAPMDQELAGITGTTRQGPSRMKAPVYKVFVNV